MVEGEREHIKNQSSRLASELSSRRRSLGIAKENLQKRRTGGLAAIGTHSHHDQHPTLLLIQQETFV